MFEVILYSRWIFSKKLKIEADKFEEPGTFARNYMFYKDDELVAIVVGNLVKSVRKIKG